MEPELRIEWRGRMAYADALALQQRCVEARRAGRIGDRLLLMEHPPVITLGRRARPDHLRLSPAELAARGVELHEVSRGGDVTYHGPGQLVGYPIVDLEARGRADVLAFLRTLEQALIDALGHAGLPACRRPGYTGVFVAGAHPRPRKLASIGIGVRGWVTYHGFALNVGVDLRGFEWIVPCGLHDVEMTSVARELGARAPGPEAMRELVAAAFRRHLAGAPAREVA